jgi:soluble lytic murein transglycosylase-like protein
MQGFAKTCAIALSFCVASGATAQDSRLQPDFTFKMVSAPLPGTAPRITIQIDPATQLLATAPVGSAPADREAGASNASQPSGLQWFWDAVSPKLADSGPGRLELAVRTLDRAPQGQGVAEPRLAALQDIASKHGIDILRETVGTKVSPALVLALISVESAGHSGAESHAGAQGLMQLMPDTAARFGVTDPLDPVQNIKGGIAYLDWLMGQFDNDPILVLAGYNAGEGSVRDNGGVPPFAETRAYVPKVLAAWTVARGLCKTPPELVTDGCVFVVSGS